jgi:hypothetical protein
MTKTFLLALSLLVSAAWVQAQSHYPPTGASQTGTTASGQTTVQGCLQDSNGAYMLTDNTGVTYQLRGDTSKLSAHVGHEVQVTGSMTSGTASNSTGASMSGTRQPILDIQNLKHMSKTCKSAGNSSK